MNGSHANGDCAPMVDRLPELALGTLTGAERAEVLDHLDQCASCRELAADWASTVDALPTLLAEAEPPSGFEARTLERLRREQARVPRRSLTYRVLSVAAIVALVMVATLATVRIIDARGSDSSTEMTSAPMVGKRGHTAGEVYLTGGDERYVFLNVDYGARSGTYRVEAVDDANRVTDLGAVSVTDGHGVWAGEIQNDGTAGAAPMPDVVRLVDDEGQAWCWARFGTEVS